jgi:hypoxanthine phosphoribosyltransferase
MEKKREADDFCDWPEVNTLNKLNEGNSHKSIDISKSVDKHYVGPQEFLEMSFELGSLVYQSEFKPDFLLALWRGGCPVGMCVQEFLKYHKVKTDHISIRTSSYIGTNQAAEIAVHGLEYIVKNAEQHHKVLIVDDIFDSGRSCQAVITELKRKMKLNCPQEFKIATVFYKPQNNKTLLKPDYFVKTSHEWIVNPIIII